MALQRTYPKIGRALGRRSDHANIPLQNPYSPRVPLRVISLSFFPPPYSFSGLSPHPGTCLPQHLLPGEDGNLFHLSSEHVFSSHPSQDLLKCFSEQRQSILEGGVVDTSLSSTTRRTERVITYSSPS